MTINVALVTNDAVVFGCDSLSSVTRLFVPADGLLMATAADGSPLLDAKGNHVYSVDASSPQHVVTDVFGGVTKLFTLCDDDNVSVAAVTAGLAIVDGASVSELAKPFRAELAASGSKYTVGEVAQKFLEYVRPRWEGHVRYHETPEDQRRFLPDITFLVGGFGANSHNGEIHRLSVLNFTCRPQFQGGNHGICWAGQADYAERLIRGHDVTLRDSVNLAGARALQEQRSAILAEVAAALASASVNLPANFQFEVTEPGGIAANWTQSEADIDYGNLPLQYAVDLVELLVNTQSGMQRLARGIPTVGGRTHVGIVRRREPFTLLNPPSLMHRNVGYGHDA